MFRRHYVHSRMLMVNDIFTCGGLELHVTDVHRSNVNRDDVVIECYNIKKPSQTIRISVSRDETFHIKNRK